MIRLYASHLCPSFMGCAPSISVHAPIDYLLQRKSNTKGFGWPHVVPHVLNKPPGRCLDIKMFTILLLNFISFGLQVKGVLVAARNKYCKTVVIFYRMYCLYMVERQHGDITFIASEDCSTTLLLICTPISTSALMRMPLFSTPLFTRRV